jgi:voltage-gated potassium channel
MVTSPAEKKLSTYDFVIGILALFSLIILFLLIFVPLSPSTAHVLNSLENFLCLVFFCDFLRSLFRAPRKWKYFFRGGGWLDLLGSLPFSSFAVFRFARLFRILRVMRTLRAGDFRAILAGRLAQNTLLFTLVAALLLVFSTAGIVLYAEMGAPHANILTYGEAVWWAFVTIATVGYGDYYPVTSLGQSMAVILMFFGLGIIGVLSSYLSSTFISFESRRREAGKENDEAKGRNEGDSAGSDAELAAIKEELAALRKLFEEQHQAH